MTMIGISPEEVLSPSIGRRAVSDRPREYIRTHGRRPGSGRDSIAERRDHPVADFQVVGRRDAAVRHSSLTPAQRAEYKPLIGWRLESPGHSPAPPAHASHSR